MFLSYWYLNLENLYKSRTRSLFSPFNLHLDQNETVFVFRGNMYWTVSADGSVDGPRPLLQRWSHLPTAIEAATFSPLDLKWYFFKGAAHSCDAPPVIKSTTSDITLFIHGVQGSGCGATRVMCWIPVSPRRTPTWVSRIIPTVPSITLLWVTWSSSRGPAILC